MTSLDALNALPPKAFAERLDGVFEHAPWVAAAAAAHRPFATLAHLHGTLMQAVRDAGPARQTAFLNGHPELQAGALPDGLTAESRAEQAGAGLAGAAGLAASNQAYRARFGFPFIVCVRRHTAANVLRVLEARLAGSLEAEMQAALAEVSHITRLRLSQRVDGPGAAPAEGRLSTHVLDTAAGRPGAGMHVALLQEGTAIGAWVTDGDGRVAGPLLPSGPLRQGHYELRFDAGAYFAGRGVACFHAVIPVAFVVAEAEAHYHVPLLLAPFGYSTYRGS